MIAGSYWLEKRMLPFCVRVLWGKALYTPALSSLRKIHLNMAAANNDGNKETVPDEPVEQIVTMENVVAVDNKGIDYDKLISE